MTTNEKRLIRNGLAVALAGFLAGFPLIYSLLGEIALSPFPVTIPGEVPGEPDQWRAMHTGSIMNGFMLIIVALTMGRLMLKRSIAKMLSWSLVAIAWANVGFYFFSIFAPNRGLTLGANRFGEASLAGYLAFFPALIGAFAIVIVFVVLLRAPWRD